MSNATWMVEGKRSFCSSGGDSGEATLFLADELLEGGEVFSTGSDGGVMGMDIDDGEGFSDFALVVSEPSEGADEVLDFGSQENGEGFTFTASDEHAFVTSVEGSGEFIEAFIGDRAEADGADSGRLAEVLFESEGALGTSEEAADLFGVDTELSRGLVVRRGLSVEFDDLVLSNFGDLDLAVQRILSHVGGF